MCFGVGKICYWLVCRSERTESEGRGLRLREGEESKMTPTIWFMQLNRCGDIFTAGKDRLKLVNRYYMFCEGRERYTYNMCDI